GDDAANEELVRRLNDSGKLYLTHTKLRGTYTLRLCIGQTNTESEHVDRAWSLLVETSKQILNEN
ncbi:MAG: aspartate aminotransferase family protein, partial [Planctomycetota bacterium]